MNVTLAGTSASFSNWTDFSCQCIKQLSKIRFVAAILHEINTANPVHELAAGPDIFFGAN